jgi:hypothetical protein
LKLALSKGPDRVDVFPSPEDGNIYSFRNVVFSGFKNIGRWTKSKNPVILNTVIYWLKARIAEPEKQPLLGSHQLPNGLAE